MKKKRFGVSIFRVSTRPRQTSTETSLGRARRGLPCHPLRAATKPRATLPSKSHRVSPTTMTSCCRRPSLGSFVWHLRGAPFRVLLFSLCVLCVSTVEGASSPSSAKAQLEQMAMWPEVSIRGLLAGEDPAPSPSSSSGDEETTPPPVDLLFVLQANNATFGTYVLYFPNPKPVGPYYTDTFHSQSSAKRRRRRYHRRYVVVERRTRNHRELRGPAVPNHGRYSHRRILRVSPGG